MTLLQICVYLTSVFTSYIAIGSLLLPAFMADFILQLLINELKHFRVKCI
jgi:hypothetical protein